MEGAAARRDRNNPGLGYDDRGERDLLREGGGIRFALKRERRVAERRNGQHRARDRQPPAVGHCDIGENRARPHRNRL